MAGFSQINKGAICEITLRTKTRPASYSFDGIGLINDKSEVRIVGNEMKVVPVNFELYQNYPNPFNPVTKIKYGIPELGIKDQSLVELKLYDILGNEIKTLVNEQKSPGSYEIVFDGSDISSGVYFYKLRCNSFSAIRKMVLTK
jgi:hypothetical protein